MILQIPVTRKAIAAYTSLAFFVHIEVMYITIAMHNMLFSFMLKKACRRSESQLLASSHLTAIRVKMRINELATYQISLWSLKGAKFHLLIVAFQMHGSVVAVVFSFPRTVVESIGVGLSVLIQNIVPSSTVNILFIRRKLRKKHFRCCPLAPSMLVHAVLLSAKSRLALVPAWVLSLNSEEDIT
jgi:hypothetical protein